MAPGALDALTKEMIYIAVSITNSAVTASLRTPRPPTKGMTGEMFHELMAVVGMANETTGWPRGTRWKSTSDSRRRSFPRSSSCIGTRLWVFASAARH